MIDLTRIAYDMKHVISYHSYEPYRQHQTFPFYIKTLPNIEFKTAAKTMPHITILICNNSVAVGYIAAYIRAYPKLGLLETDSTAFHFQLTNKRFKV